MPLAFYIDGVPVDMFVVTSPMCESRFPTWLETRAFARLLTIVGVPHMARCIVCLN